MADVILRAEAVVAGYHDLEVVRGVSVELRAGELVTIIGPNGAGKSTLLKALFGLLRPRRGRVELAGRDITAWPTNRVVAAGLAYVPQVGNVFPSLTVEENLDMGAYLRRDDIDDAKRGVFETFPALRNYARQRVGRLSGGERQMVAIGRALMAEPRALLLDEPTAALAPKLQTLVLDHVKSIATSGTPVLLVEQNARAALARSHRGYVLENGRNKYEGAGSELLADENVGKLYLGEA
jgi:neutral amino acid transport system ATP-binding protein